MNELEQNYREIMDEDYVAKMKKFSLDGKQNSRVLNE